MKVVCPECQTVLYNPFKGKLNESEIRIIEILNDEKFIREKKNELDKIYIAYTSQIGAQHLLQAQNEKKYIKIDEIINQEKRKVGEEFKINIYNLWRQWKN